MSGHAQTTILAAGQPAGYPGLATRVIDSKSASNAEASANIGYGLGVKPGPLVKEALLPTASSSVLDGIVRNVGTVAPGSFGGLVQSGTDGLAPDQMMELVTEGRPFVQVDGDAVVVPNVTRLYWRFESDGGSNTRVGTFRDTDDGHVVDTRNQVLAIGPIFSSVDVLNGGTTKICEVYVTTSNKA